MEMKLCPNNHYYDSSAHQNCPFCSAEGGDIGVTMAANTVGFTAPIMPTPAPAPVFAVPDMERTQAAVKVQTGIDPVVGWLVCIEGKEKGQDYRIHSDNNYIGRAESMDISIRNDDTISRENHAVISYDSRDKAFYFAPASGRGIVRLNDKAVLSTVELAANDVVEIGNTKLMFVPLCGGAFNWIT